jgi:hypothetical protein
MPGSWLQQTFENFDGCRLPCPIRPEQAETFAGMNLQIQSANGFDLAVIRLAQIATFDGNSHSVILPEEVERFPMGEAGRLAARSGCRHPEFSGRSRCLQIANDKLLASAGLTK